MSGTAATWAMKATMTTKTTTWAAQIAVAVLLLATGTASASSGLLSANSPRGKNSLEGSFHRAWSSVSAEPHRGWGEVCTGSAADSVVAPKTPFNKVPPEQPPFDPNGTIGAAKAWTMKGRLKAADLPTTGKIRYVPPEGHPPSQPLPRGPNGGYRDRFGNEWLKGPSRTPGQPFEWDVQIGRNATPGFRALSRDGRHVNVSLDGEVTH
jgi:hypothetical protein